MEEEKGKRESTGLQDPTEANAAGDPLAAEGPRGPTWRGWVLSILLAILLSVTATLLLGGTGAFQAHRAVAAGERGCGAGGGSGCCAPSAAEK